VFSDEIVKDLTLFFVGRFRKSFAKQFEVFVMEKFVHKARSRYTGASTTEPIVTE
jgi:hypothetical protein